MLRHFAVFSLFLLFSFSLYSQYQINGNATAIGNNCYQLTANTTGQRGTMFNVNRLDLSQPFDMYFDLFFGCNNGGADGMAFILCLDSTALGMPGGSLGYGGVTPSVAVEFDTYTNGGFGDPTTDHMALVSNGSTVHTALTNLSGPVNAIASGANIEDCNYHTVRFTWNPNTNNFRAYFDCSLRINYTGDIVTNIFSGGTSVFWGFSASTGALTNFHRFCPTFLSFLDAVTDTTVCRGDTFQVDAGPGLSYSWNPSAGLSNDTIRNPFVFPDTTTQYIVTTIDSCGLPRVDSFIVQIDTCPMMPVITTTITNCYEVLYHVDPGGGVAPYTFNWGGGNGLTGTTDTVRVNYGTGGMYGYFVTIVDALGDTIVPGGFITLQNQAFANAGKDTTLCPNQVAILGTPALPGQTYQWRALNFGFGLPGGTANSQAQVGVSFNNSTFAPITFCYELTATDTNGCQAIDTACVTYSNKPIANFIVDDTVCQGQFANVTYTGSLTPGTQYNWGFGTGMDPGGNNTATTSGPHLVAWAAPISGQQLITLTTILNGCPSDPVSKTVQVNSIPSSRFNAISPICQGQATVLTYQGGASAAATANWSLSGGTIITGTGLGPLTVTWNDTGTKIITLLVTEGGCPGNPFTDTVHVRSIPTATMSNPGSACVGDSVQIVYTGNALPSAVYTWNLDGGGAFPFPPGPGPVKVAWSTPGTKTVTLNVQQNGCFSSIGQISILIHDKPSVQVNGVADQCFTGNSFDFTAVGAPGNATYNWFMGNSATPATSTAASPTGISYSSPGIKTVTLTVSANGCTSDPAMTSFEVIEEPLADFTTQVPGGTVCSTDSVTFLVVNPPVGASQTYQWSFGIDAIPQTSSLPSPAPVTYSSGGVKIVTLTVSYKGCTDTHATNFRVESSPTLIAGPDRSYCEGDGGVQIDASSSGGTPAYVYSWWCNSGGCGISNVGVEDPMVNPLAVAPDTITFCGQIVDSKGCMSRVDCMDVLVHPKPKVDAGPDDTLCSQGPGATLMGGLAANNKAIGPFSWQWTDEGNNIPPHGMLPPNDKNPSAYTRPDTTIIYVLVATDLGTGCSSNPTTVNPLSTATVVVRDNPVAQPGQDTVMCLGDTIHLNGFASGAAGPYTYSWTPTSTGYVDDPNRPDPRVSPLQTTTFTLVATANGCDSRGEQITVFVETIPTLEAGENLSMCQGDTVLMGALASGSPFPGQTAYSFVWSPRTNLSDPFSPEPFAYPDTTTKYVVVATSNRGCGSAKDSMTVTVKPTPIAHVVTLDTLICIGETLQLVGSHSFVNTDSVPPNQVIYRWSPRASIQGSMFDNPVTVKPDESTAYLLETNVLGCKTFDQVIVNVSQQPTAAITASDTVICAGEVVQLMGQGGFGSSTYLWSPSSGVSDSSIVDPIVEPMVTTTYMLTIEEGACTSDTSIRIKVLPFPVADYFSTQTDGCPGLEVSFIENATDALFYSWNFGDGSPTDNTPNPLHVYSEPGMYPVTLIVQAFGGCADTVTKVVVNIGDGSFADFTSDPLPDVEQVLPDAVVSFTDLSQQGVNWLWDFGDGSTSAAQNPDHIYREPGDYEVTLTVTDVNGCISTIVKGKYVVFAPDLFIPNVFSPNDDGVNDVFEIVYTGKEDFSLELFDRWGRVVYTADRAIDTWNGIRETGDQAPEGVYFYSLTIGDRTYTGNVTLLR